MRISSSAKYALGVAAAIAMLAGCNGGGSQVAPAGPTMGSPGIHMINGHVKPVWAYPASLVPRQQIPKGPVSLHGVAAPAIAMRGIYVSEFLNGSMFGYMKGNRANNPAICTVPFAVNAPNSIAVDGAGNLIEPDGGGHAINIGQGPNMCGALAATITDPYGQPSDASSANALTGTIAVGNIFDNSGASGSISVCTVAGGCTVNLTNPAMYEVAGVAMANNGDCWADAIDSSGAATLTYFASCTGAGVQATGFTNAYYGGIDIDASGNLVTISAFTPSVVVYSGCNPACTLISTSSLTAGDAVFGHLNNVHNNKLATGNYSAGQVDIYRYSPASGVTYAYSFNNGLSASLSVEGVAYNKRSPQ